MVVSFIHIKSIVFPSKADVEKPSCCTSLGVWSRYSCAYVENIDLLRGSSLLFLQFGSDVQSVSRPSLHPLPDPFTLPVGPFLYSGAGFPYGSDNSHEDP